MFHFLCEKLSFVTSFVLKLPKPSRFLSLFLELLHSSGGFITINSFILKRNRFSLVIGFKAFTIERDRIVAVMPVHIQILQDCTWIRDTLETPGAAGMGSDIDEA